MSMGASVPHNEAWPRDSRQRDAAKVVQMLIGRLKIENAPHIAATYGIPTAFVEAEMMKHLQEGEGK